MQNENYSTFANFYPERLPYALGLAPDALDEYIYPAINPSSASDILMRDMIVLDKHLYGYNNDRNYYSDMGRYIEIDLKLSGPWNINTSHMSYKAMKELADNQNLYPLLETLALDNLNAPYNQRLMLYTPYVPEVKGHATYEGEVVMFGDEDIESTRSTLAHELSHREKLLLNRYKSSNPYPGRYNANEDFETVMQETLNNLQKLKKVYETEQAKSINPFHSMMLHFPYNKVDDIVASSEQDPSIYKIFTVVLHANTLYSQINHHAEFVVYLHQVIASYGGELPPHIREAINPLEDYYKTRILPRSLRFIETHPHKDMLLQGDMEKFHPETITYSRKAYLDYKADKGWLNEEDVRLLDAVKSIDDLIQRNNFVAAGDLLGTLDEWGRREALSSAIEHGKLLFDEILEGIEGKKYTGPQLLLAAQKGQYEMVDKLLPHIDNQYYLAKAVEVAAEKDDKELLSKLTYKKIDPFFLQSSINKAKDGKLKQFIKNWGHPLQQAVAMGDLDALRSLIGKGGDPNFKCDDPDETPLVFKAAKERKTDIVKFLIENGADREAKNKWQQNLLDISIDSGDQDLVEYLIKNNIFEVDTKSRYGRTGLLAALDNNRTKIAEFLIENRTNINITDDFGITALHLCSDVHVAKLLIEKGAAVNIKDKRGNTPLHYAVDRNMIQVGLLIQNGADITIANNEGNTPLQLAPTEEIREFIRSTTKSHHHQSFVEKVGGKAEERAKAHGGNEL